jgi:hypothetical protein
VAAFDHLSCVRARRPDVGAVTCSAPNVNPSRTSQGLRARSGSPVAHRNALTELAAFVVEDVEPSTGAGAIVSVKTFLDRLDTLEDDKDRKAARKVGHAALATLAKRGSQLPRSTPRPALR